MSALAIFAPRRFIRLMVSDAKNISRDPMLIAVSGLSIGPAAGFWFGKAAMDDAALAAFGVAHSRPIWSRSCSSCRRCSSAG